MILIRRAGVVPRGVEDWAQQLFEACDDLLKNRFELVIRRRRKRLEADCSLFADEDTIGDNCVEVYVKI